MKPEYLFLLCWFLPGLIALVIATLFGEGKWDDPITGFLCIICGAMIFGPFWFLILLVSYGDYRRELKQKRLKRSILKDPPECPICGWHESLGALRTWVMKALR